MAAFRALASAALAFALAAPIVVAGCAQGDANLGAVTGDAGLHDAALGDGRVDGGDNRGDGSVDSKPIFPDAPLDTKVGDAPADGPHDSAPPVDTGATDAPADTLVVDTGTVDTGADAPTCTAGASCPSGDPCRTAAIDCSTGAPVCKATGTVPNGTACGAGNVCKDGACAACAEGSSCATSTVCHVGKIACASGAPVCVDGGNAPNGTSCGAGLVCDAGACVACATGASCVPADPCHSGRLDCSTGAPVCGDTGVSLPNGTSCGTGSVCSGGTCVACAAGTSCAASSACKTATISCGTGAPVCSDTGNAPDGTACGGGKACSGGSCACPGALRDCGGTCVDIASDRNNCGGCGTVCGASDGCSAGACTPSTVTVSFPSASDASYSLYSYYWNAGDYVDGSRPTALPSASSVSIHLVISSNGLTCDTQDMKMMINGMEVGRFSVFSGATSVDQSFSFGSIAGSTYELRYETVRTVAPGCGAADLDKSSSTVTLNR